MEANSASQDELQKAINSITSASGATGAVGEAAAVSQITDKLAAAPVVAPHLAPIEPAMTQPVQMPEAKAMYGDPDLDRVKTSALTDLRPILETVDIPAEKKFMIYKDIIEITEDKACIEPAYNAAKNIVEDKARAEALLYIVETIDKLGIQMQAKAAV